MKMITLGKLNLPVGFPVHDPLKVMDYTYSHGVAVGVQCGHNRAPHGYGIFALSYAHASLAPHERTAASDIIKEFLSENGRWTDIEYGDVTRHADQLVDFAQIEGWSDHWYTVLPAAAIGLARLADNNAACWGGPDYWTGGSTRQLVRRVIQSGQSATNQMNDFGQSTVGSLAKDTPSAAPVPPAGPTIDEAISAWVGPLSATEQSRRGSSVRTFCDTFKLDGSALVSELANIPANAEERFDRFVTKYAPLSKRGALNRVLHIARFLDQVRASGVVVPVCDWDKIARRIKRRS